MTRVKTSDLNQWDPHYLLTLRPFVVTLLFATTIGLLTLDTSSGLKIKNHFLGYSTVWPSY